MYGLGESMADMMIEEALTFDDILLIPSFSDVVPKDVDVRTRLTKRISLSIPIISAAMDTVTEAQTSISLAQEGGMGIIHRNMSIKSQAQEGPQESLKSGVPAPRFDQPPDQDPQAGSKQDQRRK